jgi:hypothetical protein
MMHVAEGRDKRQYTRDGTIQDSAQASVHKSGTIQDSAQASAGCHPTSSRVGSVFEQVQAAALVIRERHLAGVDAQVMVHGGGDILGTYGGLMTRRACLAVAARAFALRPVHQPKNSRTSY